MPIGKNDSHARDVWGDAYDEIPKSVFATLAWYLAGRAVDSADDPDQVRALILEELDALTAQVIPERQAKAALKAARAAFGGE